MKKTIFVVALIVVLFIGGIWYFSRPKKNSEPALNPSGFDISFLYGFGNGLGKTDDTDICRGLNTFENYLARCVASSFDSHRKAKFALSQSDREEIRQKINELNLINIQPMDVDNDSKLCNKQTHQKYLLTIRDGSNEWNRTWDNCSGNDKINPSYAAFASFMINFIESKEEFKRLDNDLFYIFLGRF